MHITNYGKEKLFKSHLHNIIKRNKILRNKCKQGKGRYILELPKLSYNTSPGECSAGTHI